MNTHVVRLVAVLQVVISPQVFSQGGAHEILTAHTPENARFLRYHSITSAYDSVTLHYQIGEVWVHTRQGQWKPICWAIPHVLGDPRFGWPYRVITDTAQGDAQSLLPYLQSEPFERESLDSIRFYRVFRLGVSCHVNMDPIGADTLDLPPGDGNPLADRWRNTFWVAPEGTSLTSASSSCSFVMRRAILCWLPLIASVFCRTRNGGLYHGMALIQRHTTMFGCFHHSAVVEPTSRLCLDGMAASSMMAFASRPQSRQSSTTRACSSRNQMETVYATIPQQVLHWCGRLIASTSIA